jgi:C-methyltransferase
MERPELLSDGAGQSAARAIDEMSRLYYLSRAIQVAAELGIADHLGDDQVALDDLARTTGTNAGALKRLLRFLSAYRVFEERSPDRFGNTTLSSVLRAEHPNSMRANLRRMDASWWSAAAALEHSIRTGEAAFTHVHGVPFFQHLRANAEAQKRFDEGMAQSSLTNDAAIAAAYDFKRFRRIVDLGGGRGGLLVQILVRAPEATGVLFDQPQVVEQATPLGEAGLARRVELVAGDFFQSVAEGGDCYVIKGVLHDFDDEQCIRILSNCRRAMRADGCVVIANQDLPTSIDGPHPNLTMDIQMMALLGGRERSVVEWAELFRRSGLRLSNTIPTDVGFTLVEGKPD